MIENTHQQVKHLVEVIAREVLIAINEQDYKKAQPAGEYCTSECAEGICVDTCFNSFVMKPGSSNSLRFVLTLHMLSSARNCSREPKLRSVL